MPVPRRQNQTPLCDIMDMPPSNDTVAKEDFKFPKTTSKNYNYYFTTRRPFWERYFTTKRYIWEDWEDYTTDTPSFRDVPPGQNDIQTFFIVFLIGVLVISLLSYFAFCHPTSSSTSNSSSDGIRRPVAGAVIHPPPRGLLTSPIVPTAPRGSINYPLTASYTNAGYQPDRSVVVDGSRPGDAPPDYAAVALGDLTSTNKVFPSVKPMETPPPQYQNEGKPFK
ncbi:hypothetical protein JTE90_004983 [Oedothorax gibbosus]|uniref:Uncharacterized protein n=1 Tax=Oedothorax gibbosus TaxID=931172 RepID=A0AAV6VIY3_9ARAC|nr:hypothetical protein JTE90_004983 [Oedothorax gibbosus]